MNDRPASGHFAASLLLFGITALVALLMGLTALLVWLSMLTGSFVLSAVILGVLFALIAGAIYRYAIREELQRLRTQVETVYEVAHAARMGYEWIVAKVVRLLRPEPTRHGTSRAGQPSGNPGAGNPNGGDSRPSDRGL